MAEQGAVNVIITKKAIAEIKIAQKELNVLAKQILTINKASMTAGGGTAANILKQNAALRRQLIIKKQLLVATNKQLVSQKKLITSTKGATKATSSFGGALKSLGLLFVAQKVLDLTKALFSLTKQLNAMSFSMQAVIKDSFELFKTNQFLRQIAKDYGADLLVVTNRYIKFRAAAKEANFTAKETQKIFGTMTKAAGVLGLKTDELKGIYLALEQMISKGKITTEELRRQLGERLPGAMDIMAKSMGVSTAKLDDMLKKGEVLTKDVLPKFAEQVEKSFGIDTVTKIDTLTASSVRFDNAWVIFVENIENNKGALSSFFKSVTDFGTTMIEIADFSSQAADNILEFFNNILLFSKGLGMTVVAEAMLRQEHEKRVKLSRILATLEAERDKELIAMNPNLTKKAVIERTIQELMQLGSDEIESRIVLLKAENEELVVNEDLLNGVIEAVVGSVSWHRQQVAILVELRDKLETTSLGYQEQTVIIDKYNERIDIIINGLKSLGREMEVNQDIFDTGGLFGKSGQGGLIMPTIFTDDNQAEEAIAKQIELAGELFDGVADLGDAFFSRQVAQIDAEIQAQEDKYDILFALAEGDAEQTRLLKIQEEEDRQKLEDKRRKALKKQAIANKVQAIADIAINTAVWITKAGSEAGLFGLTLTPFIAALGALQAATVLAQPIPAFAEGGTMKKDGVALVGDGGKREVVMSPDGKLMLTPSRDTLMNIEAGSKIYKSIESFNSEMPEDISDKLYSATIMASLSLNQKAITDMLGAQRELDNKLLEAMLENTQVLRKKKLTSVHRSQRIDIPHSLYLSRYNS